ncbi:MAG: bifunctional diaminohydroxyphosphoribosylaminopyrimidine deaminase/5-amino-6-(5-phosphoribosylamino)uracil reductase RibD [Nitrospirae bacterium]|nr:bifunctional diaminohydroxyphosphoribosylaminopyrimidine deaminase/5-amino-6-(5-phosphoribosylamino)uracil reductase RibD [Nitrospirota bacterium]
MDNSIFMKKALRLAARGRGRTSPNPTVGAVIVKSGKIIAEDYHRKSGTPHAEILALRKAGKLAKGATLFINLEPCCHTDKKTPPCTDAIIESGLKKVVIAMTDPNPKVSGKGIKALKSAGIATEVGLMETEAKRLNETFAKFITKKEPFVILKAAQSLDGKIATASGESKWITGDKARQYVHKLRNEVDAIMVGIGTVIADNPSLDCRMRGGRNPYRIIIDSSLLIPLNAKVLKHNDQKTIIATTKIADREKINSVIKKGYKVLSVKSKAGKVDLKSLMKELGRLEITSVMIEGGASLNASALLSSIVDKVIFFCAPKIMGGLYAVPSVGGISPASLKNIIKVKNLHVKKIGDDFIFEGYI